MTTCRRPGAGDGRIGAGCGPLDRGPPDCGPARKRRTSHRTPRRRWTAGSWSRCEGPAGGTRESGGSWRRSSELVVDGAGVREPGPLPVAGPAFSAIRSAMRGDRVSGCCSCRFVSWEGDASIVAAAARQGRRSWPRSRATRMDSAGPAVAGQGPWAIRSPAGLGSPARRGAEARRGPPRSRRSLARGPGRGARRGRWSWWCPTICAPGSAAPIATSRT